MRTPFSKPRLKGFVGNVFSLLRLDASSYLFLFLLGLILRGVPELLVSWYPVGYETITYYAPAMMSFAGRGLPDVFVEFFRSGPLFYALMWFAVNVTGAHPFVVLKVVGPLLYGGLLVSFFVFLKRGLKLEWKLAFATSFLLAFQVAALRESWDRFRTVLGLVFLFWTLTGLKSDFRGKWWLVAGLSVLTMLSREYVGLVLFVMVLGFVFLAKRNRLKSLVSLVPALAILGVVGIPNLFGSVVGYASVGLFGVRGYSWVVEDAFVIFMLCYLGLLPFVFAGLRGDRLVGSMLIWLLLGSFSVLFPFAAIPGYQRWLMLLVFPFCVFAVWGFERLRLFNGRRLWMLATVVLAFVMLGAGYSTGFFSYVGLMSNSYVAVDLVGSSIRWDQINDLKAVLAWLNENAVSNSSVLVEECFLGWTQLYLRRANEDVRVIPYGAASPPSSVLEIAIRGGFSRIYLIWYTQEIFSDFQVVQSQNAISIFQYLHR